MTTQQTDYGSSVLSKDSPGERERLASIQRSVDAHTTATLETFPIAPSWDCLEVGAGAGSIAYWLAERCPDGRVVAVDSDTRYLDASRAENLDVQQADITETSYEPGSFDLIHARYVLCHLPERDGVLARAARWLKPGGVLVVQDPYLLPPETSPFPVVSRIMSAYQQVYAGHGADLLWVRGLPALLAGNGLTEVGFTGNLACMGCLGKDRWRPLVNQVAPAMLGQGLVSEADLAEFAALLDDPSFVDVPQFTMCAWGRRPREDRR